MCISSVSDHVDFSLFLYIRSSLFVSQFISTHIFLCGILIKLKYIKKGNFLHSTLLNIHLYIDTFTLRSAVIYLKDFLQQIKKKTVPLHAIKPPQLLHN